VARVLALPVRGQGPRPSPRPRPLDAIALPPAAEDCARHDVEPVDSRRTLRLGLELEI